MIDRILDFKDEVHTKEEIYDFQKEIINSKNARYIFLFAYYINGCNKKKLERSILKANDKKYIEYFLRSIKNINIRLFVNKIIEFKDSKLMFYTVYDTENLPEKYILKITKSIIKTKDDYYLNRLLYYYFNILNLKSKKMFKILLKILVSKNINVKNITIDNCSEIIEKIKIETSRKLEIKKYEKFTDNCYKGRKDYIPFIIVCHSTSDYKRAINTFYDPSSEVSSHFMVGENGEYTQIVDLKDSSWANGTSLNQESNIYYRFCENELIKDKKDNANYFTFSIEHESMDGKLSEPQYNTTLNIMKNIITFLKEEYDYDFIIDRSHIVGHKEINPIVRNICPGKYFPFDRIIKDLLEWKK